MAYFLIEDFKAGLDARRMAVSSVPGSLLELTNAHITRGGEIEKRPAFVPVSSLPSDSFGLHAVGTALYTFGSAASVTIPPDAPANLTYQQLSHPSALNMTKILHTSTFNGLPYVIAQYDDGSVWHFYNGSRISDWEDGRARASFTVTGGTAGGVQATASFEVTGGINSPSDTISQIRIGTFPLISGIVQHDGSNTSTAASVANAINSFVGSPDFTAVAAGSTVTITAVTPGTTYNGMTLSVTTNGSFTVGSLVNATGGVDNAVALITVNGVRITGAPVLHTGDDAETAEAVAAEINNYSSSPDYFATSVGAKVNVVSVTGGTGPNGYGVFIVNAGDVTTSTTSTSMAGGAATAGTYIPGEYAKPAKAKMYSVAGSALHFSKIDDPTDLFDTVGGAGFVNLSNSAEGSEVLTAIANYQTNLAIFSERTVQIWFIDVDAAANQQLQVLNNTGAIAPRSIVEWGDADVFYLSESGIRSLRSRDAYNAAFTSDVGNAIDELITAELRTNRLAAQNAIGILEPRDGRYMLAIGEKIYVFSYFSASKVSAWSTYEPGFAVEAWGIVGRKLYCRADNQLYLFGGDDGATYDNSTVTVQLPYLDASSPATKKSFYGLDIACEGQWTIETCTDPNDLTKRQTVATVYETTYDLGHATLQEYGTTLAFRLTNNLTGPAKIGNLVLHYTGGEAG